MGNNTNTISFNIDELSIYRKKEVELFFVESLDIEAKGAEIIVPTLEGEVTISASPEIYIMIGPFDDIYPIPRNLFDSRYEVIQTDGEYPNASLLYKAGWKPSKVGRCKLRQESFVYAKEVPFDFAVYVKHSDSLIYGKAGDYYAVSFEDKENAYIINAEVMKKTYEKMECINDGVE